MTVPSHVSGKSFSFRDPGWFETCYVDRAGLKLTECLLKLHNTQKGVRFLVRYLHVS